MNGTTPLFGSKLHLHNYEVLSLVIQLQGIFSELTKILDMLLIPPISHVDVINDYLYCLPSVQFYFISHFFNISETSNMQAVCRSNPKKSWTIIFPARANVWLSPLFKVWNLVHEHRVGFVQPVLKEHPWQAGCVLPSTVSWVSGPQ